MRYFFNGISSKEVPCTKTDEGLVPDETGSYTAEYLVEQTFSRIDRRNAAVAPAAVKKEGDRSAGTQ